MSESSLRITSSPQPLQIYLPLPGFSPVVGIISPLSKIYKFNSILAERGDRLNMKMGLIYRPNLIRGAVNSMLTEGNYIKDRYLH